MVNRLPGFGGHHFRHEMAMAIAMITFEAQHAAPPFCCQNLRFRQGPLRFGSFHMGIEYRVASPDRVAARLRRTEALKVDVADSRLVKPGGKLPFRETRFA